MANYNTLKSDIQAAIYQNGENAITGQILQEQLLSMVTSLGAGYQYGGVATPSTNPGEPDYKVFYLAGTEGTYTNFGGIVVANEVAILYGSGTSWTKADTGIKFVSVSQNIQTGHTDINIGGVANPVASVEEVTELGQQGTYETAKIESLLGVNATEITTAPAVPNPTGYIVKYSNGDYQVQDGCNLTNPITLKKGESVVVLASQYTTACVIFNTILSTHSYGAKTPLVEGIGNTTQHYYIYTARKNSENVAFGYIGNKEFKVYKVSSTQLSNIYSEIENLNEEKLSINSSFNGNALFPFIQGNRVDGVTINETNKKITSQIVRFTGTLTIEYYNNSGIRIEPWYKPKDGSWSNLGWKEGAGIFSLEGDGYLYINVWTSDNRILPVSEGRIINCFYDNTAASLDNNRVYNFTIFNQGVNELFYEQPDIFLKKNRRYRFEFSGNIQALSQSGEILNLLARHCINAREYHSILYLNNGNTDFPSVKYITVTEDSYLWYSCTIGKDSYLNVSVQEVPISVHKAISEHIDSQDKIGLLISNLKARQFTTGDVLTTTVMTLVMSNGFDIDELGNCYIGMKWAENTSTEQQNPLYNAGLIICNILNPSETKELHEYLHNGDIIFGESCMYYSEQIAKKISSNQIAVHTCNAYLGALTYSLTRLYNTQSKTFGEWSKCYINVGSDRYEMKEDETTVEAIYAATGMYNWKTVPAIFNGYYGFRTSGNPIKIGEWFYVPSDIGHYSPALLKTQDFIDFYYVCELPFGATIDGVWVGNPTEEIALAYMNNRIYATCRGNRGRFEGLTPGVDYVEWAQIMSCNFDEIVNYNFETSQNKPNWSVPLTLAPCCLERPALVAYNNKLFCWQGQYGNTSYKSIEGKNINRTLHQFIVFDRNLNILQRELIGPDDGCLHPVWLKYYNSVYSVNHTDLRNFAYRGGDNRSELALNRLDMNLLEM